MADYLSLITIGGSTTECFYLSDGKTWTELLGLRLARDFPKVWINNAGLDGATTYRHLILLEDYVVQLKPNLGVFLQRGSTTWGWGTSMTSRMGAWAAG